MKCSQTNKKYTIKVKDLTTETSDPLTDRDLTKNTKLVMTYRGKPYPVQFLQFKGNYLLWGFTIAIHMLRYTIETEQSKRGSKEKDPVNPPEDDASNSNTADVLAKAKVRVCLLTVL